MDGSARSTCRLEATGGTGRDSSVSEGCATTDSEVGAPGGAVAPIGSARRTRAARQRCTNTTMPAATTRSTTASQIGKPLDPDAGTPPLVEEDAALAVGGTGAPTQGGVRCVADAGTAGKVTDRLSGAAMRRGVFPASAVKRVNSAPVKGPALTVRVPVVRSPGTTNEYVASKSPSSALPFRWCPRRR